MNVAVAPTSANTDICTLYVNGSATNIAVTITGTATSGSDTTDTASATAGQTMYWSCAISASATPPSDVRLSITETTP
jgi:hypothetical protein